MDVSVRHPLAAGLAMSAAAAVALTPVVLPIPGHPALTPAVATPRVALTVSAADIEALIADVRTGFGAATTAATAAVGTPGRALIGVVDNIVTSIDVVFSRLIAATGDPTAVSSLTILKTLSVDAYAMLATNLRRGNAVLTDTTTEVGELLTDALTGSLRNVLLAASNVVNAPLSPASYTGLLTAGIASGALLAGRGLDAVQAVGDAGFELTHIAIDEVTFQFNNALGRLGTLLTELGDASGSPVVEAVVGAVRGLAFAPALAVFNAGSHTASAVLGAANAGFDQLLDAAGAVVDPKSAPQQAVTSTDTNADRVADTAAEDVTAPADDVTEEAADDAAEQVATEAVAADETGADETGADETDAATADVSGPDVTETDVTEPDEPAAEPARESEREPQPEPKDTVTEQNSDTPAGTDAAA